jgi:prepilin-type N-terminal cleavage/methylation domain-containing protein/prepilin-type processing-associated H-X9-DG protein
MRTDRTGLTLIEVLVVLVVITILIVILIPALGMARERARSTQCTNHLSKIGLGLFNLMTENARSRHAYSSGAVFPLYDGDPRQVGWMADLVNGRQLDLNRARCPSNPAQVSKSISIDELRRGFSVGNLDGVTTGSDEELSELQRALIAAGYNTNYCQTWYMARTAMLPVIERKGTDASDVMDPRNTRGPLLETVLVGHSIPSEMVMLLADGAPISVSGPENEVAAAITKGPIDPDDPQSRHKFNELGLVHGGGGKHHVNVLFADGHVSRVVDENGNGRIDPSEFGPDIWVVSPNIRPRQLAQN